jgi:hypothetical protein
VALTRFELQKEATQQRIARALESIAAALERLAEKIKEEALTKNEGAIHLVRILGSLSIRCLGRRNNTKLPH